MDISILSLGCSKNLVDSQCLARLFAERGLAVQFVDTVPTDGTTLVVNTCGFIGDAKEESVNVLLEAIQNKNEGTLAGVYAMGCLSERYREDLTAEIPELDGLYGKFDWKGLADELGTPSESAGTEIRMPFSAGTEARTPMAYIKISEGCNRFCAFCAIPLITGRHHSRTPDDILTEVTALAKDGVKEFNIIAQDLSSYGFDLPGGKSRLAALIDAMVQIPGVEMIRLHYAYPSDFPYDILPVIARHPQVCKYLDIALQHVNDTVLANMRRHITGQQTRELLQRIRREVPGIHIRTTLMVGFPGEDDAAFEQLLDFVAEQRFERLGAFAYCEEEGTYAAKHFADKIPADVKQKRLDRLMALQQDIAFEHAQSKIGSTLRVIVDAREGDVFVGRTEYDSPEVDCNVYIDDDPAIKIGNIYNIDIYDAEGFDLIGRLHTNG